MEIDFDSARWTIDGNGTWLCLRALQPRTAREACNRIKPEKKYTALLKAKRKKRSLDANAYFWVLAGKLAAVLHVEKEQVYRSYIREIGNNFEVVPVRNDAVETWTRNWKCHGIGWVCDNLGPSKIDGYTNVACYYGSSTYDSRQMSCLIDMAVQDCKDQDIETMTPDEIDAMKASWANE